MFHPGPLSWTDSYYDPVFFGELRTPCHPAGYEKRGRYPLSYRVITGAEVTNPCVDIFNSVEKGVYIYMCVCVCVCFCFVLSYYDIHSHCNT